LHHVTLDQWSRRSSPVHRRDARVKLLGLLVFLIVMATTGRKFAILGPIYLLLVVGFLFLARLPLLGVGLRAGIVLPFSATFACISALGGDPGRGLILIGKSFLSALAVLAVVGSTPLPDLLRGLQSLRVPHFLVLVGQFVYRYLFVVSEEAQHMRVASSCRGRLSFRAAAGLLAVLFERSYARAERIHQAMAARGFQGHFPAVSPARPTWADVVFLLLSALGPAVLRVFVERRV